MTSWYDIIEVWMNLVAHPYELINIAELTRASLQITWLNSCLAIFLMITLYKTGSAVGVNATNSERSMEASFDAGPLSVQ